MQSYRIGAVEYLNALPLISGLMQADFMRPHHLFYATPVELYRALCSGELDMALISSITLNKLSDAYSVGDYGIAGIDYVASVGIFAQVPLAQVKRIFLDKSSLSSVALLKILLENYYAKLYNIQAEVLYEPDDGVFFKEDAWLIIGDMALREHKNFAYYYDLCAAWNAWTQLPFVFARWIARKPIDMQFVQHFDDFQRQNLTKLSEIIAQVQPPHPCDLFEYYGKQICYFIDGKMNQGLERFLQEVNKTPKL